MRLSPGDVLESGSAVRKGRSPHVYLAGTIDEALGWGLSRAHREGSFESDPRDPTGFASRATVPVFVYEVEPIDPKPFRTGYRARRARIVALAVREDPRR